MENRKKEIIETFGNKLRIRLSGLCIEDNKILLVKHLYVGKKDVFWAPPGGGLNYGEAMEECLKREFKEETGYLIEIEDFLFVNEFLAPPLHAIELFFKVKIVGGKIQIGTDPEITKKNQIIKDVKFLSFKEIKQQDKEIFHNLFKVINSPEEAFQLKGILRS